MPDSATSNSSSNPEHTQQSATNRLAVDSAPRQDAMPKHQSPARAPLPGAWPASAAEPSVSAPAGEIPIIPRSELQRDRDDNATRPLVGPDRWVSEQEFWETNTFIALSGRHAIPRPRTKPLQPPQRFRPMPRWRSYLLLLVVCLMIGGSLAGVVAIGRLSAQAFGPHHPIATPAPAHTATPAHPTATPKKHK